MIKRLLLFSLMTMLALTSSAKIYIPLVKSVPPTTGSGGDARAGIRSGSYSPLAYYEEKTLYIQFPVSTTASVIITNDSTDLAVISEIFANETVSAQIDFSSLNYQNAYNISVNAFGTWWVGYIDLRTVGTPQLIRRGVYAVLDDSGDGRNYSIYGVAGNATSGWNFGVSGFLSGNNGGTGIYGSSKNDNGFNTGGRYAGLFHGDIKTTDAVYASVYNTFADSRFTNNSQQIESGSLDNLMQISVLKYSLKQINVDSGEKTKTLGYFNDDSGILGIEHFGLSGQEIKEIYPNLVSESQDGYLTINYVEMIPLLIQSIQELKSELDELKTNTKVSERISEKTSVLYQNSPNPFRDRCVIKCTIPAAIQQASFYIYDYNGRQIHHRTIKDRGSVQIVVEGNELEAGLYLYSLVTDGELIDTKRMIHILE